MHTSEISKKLAAILEGSPNAEEKKKRLQELNELRARILSLEQGLRELVQSRKSPAQQKSNNSK